MNRAEKELKAMINRRRSSDTVPRTVNYSID
ncbi:hypothetical protein VCG_002116 [Vibrio cholerae 12129(1)]|nr:hypothetical protein VCG_002116 [Vibrio cholerae 12129(1)]